MQPSNQTDHIALLALTMVGVLVKRLNELAQLDADTAKHLHLLVEGVRKHAQSAGLTDLKILFDNLDRALAAHPTPATAG